MMTSHLKHTINITINEYLIVEKCYNMLYTKCDGGYAVILFYRTSL
jgi:hypothetical protein